MPSSSCAWSNEREERHIGFELKKVEDVVDAAVNHKWGVPEF
jgi:hypothetical protein